MKKTALFLVGDYWHHKESMEPLRELIFPENEWRVVFTEDPKDFLEMMQAPEIIISFKDPIENDQIPTPVWCDEEWTEKLFDCVRKKGTGVILAHAAVTDLEEDHPIVKDMIQASFIGHPRPCPVTFSPIKVHEILQGVSEFTFPEYDEHYMMKMLTDSKAEILAQTVSENGTQPGLWVRELENSRICCITPAHTLRNLTYESFVRLLKNAVEWCCRRI